MKYNAELLTQQRECASNLRTVHSGIPVRLIKNQGPYLDRGGWCYPWQNAQPPSEQEWWRCAIASGSSTNSVFQLGRSIALRASVVAKRVWYASSGIYDFPTGGQSCCSRSKSHVWAKKKGAKEPRAHRQTPKAGANKTELGTETEKREQLQDQYVLPFTSDQTKPMDLPEDGQGTSVATYP